MSSGPGSIVATARIGSRESTAFCAHARLSMAGHGRGPLRGMTFAVKDVIAVAGHTACFGNPTWLATHPPALHTAGVVDQLLDSGASLCGVTVTDEMAFSLTGENIHYGTPLNSAAPDRVPGGSSSGSASAVAAGACDFALGTDTGGSVRVPASHCGLWGFRPTHGAVSMEGVLPFAPSFDTVGWFAREAATLATVGDALLPAKVSNGSEPAPRHVHVLADAVALVDPSAREPLNQAFRALAGVLKVPMGEETSAGEIAGHSEAGPLTTWVQSYAALQNADIARTHGGWIERCRPTFGALIASRMARALVGARDSAAVSAADRHRAAIRARVAALVAPGSFLALPSACGVAPRKGRGDSEIDEETSRALTLSCIASLCGLPQISLPLCRVGDLPLGISLIAGAGQDRALLTLARRLLPQTVGPL